MFINVRVGLGWAIKVSSSNPSASTSQQARNNGRVEGAYNMRPLTVNITRVIDKEDGEPYGSEDSIYREPSGRPRNGKDSVV